MEAPQSVMRKSDYAKLADVSGAAVNRACHTTLKAALTPDGKLIDASHPVAVEYIQRRYTRKRPGFRPKSKKLPSPSTPPFDPFAVALKAATIEPELLSPRGDRVLPPEEPMQPPQNGATSGPSIPDVAPTPPPQWELSPGEHGVQHSLSIIQDMGGGHLPPDITDLGAMTIREMVERFGTLPALRDYTKSLKDFAAMQVQEGQAARKRGEVIERKFVSGTLIPFIELAFKRLVTEAPQALTQRIIARVLAAGGDDLKMDVEKLIRDENSGILKDCQDKLAKSMEEI